MIDFQQTLGKAISVTGVGLHSGQEATVTLRPAEDNAGVTVRRTDVAAGDIPLNPTVVGETTLCTTIGNAAGVQVKTVEHLLSSLYALNVDNVVIEIDGPEIPILDGSASPWVAAIDEAGRVAQAAPAPILTITKPITHMQEGRLLEALPDPRPGLRIAVTVDFPHPVIGRQELAIKVDEETFRKEIAPARTFCLERDVQAMQAAGLIQGGSLDCAVVFAENGTVVNPSGLRFKDEPIRHKMLDAIGDFALANKRISGKLNLTMPGHGANNELLRKIVALC